MKTINWAILIIFVTMSGCVQSRAITLWKARDVDFLNYRTIMVLGPTTDNDSTLEGHMEGHLVGDLDQLGYIAESALQKYGVNAFQNMSARRINEKLKTSDVEALITIVLLKKDTGMKFVPGTLYLSQSSRYPENYYDFDKGSPDLMYDPGYYVKYSDYFWISSVYDVNTGKLVYSVQMHSNSQVNTQVMAHEYAQNIVKNMQKKKVIRKKNNLKPF